MTILHSQTQDEYFYLEFSQSLTICRIPSKNEIRKMLEKGWYRKFLRHGAAMLKKHIDPCQNEKQFFDDETSNSHWLAAEVQLQAEIRQEQASRSLGLVCSDPTDNISSQSAYSDE